MTSTAVRTFSPSSIAHLLGWRSPSAIARFVVHVVVDSVKSSALRLMTHICKELLKGVQPLRAHRDASASVISESFVIRIGASLFRQCPANVFRCSARSTPSHAMCRASLGGRVLPEASARLRATYPQTLNAGYGESSAIATTNNTPESAWKWFGVAEDNQTSKSQSSYVNIFGHSPRYSTPCL